MIRYFLDSLRVSQNIARQLGIDYPTKILYIDPLAEHLKRVRHSLALISEKHYETETCSAGHEASNLIKNNPYDVILLSDTVHFDPDRTVQECPLIVVPTHILQLSEWKLAYTLDELISEHCLPLQKAQRDIKNSQVQIA